MKNIILTVFVLLIGSKAFGQINMADSTVQVVTYWDKREKKSYSVTAERFKIKNSDTISRERTTYDVEITVLNTNDKSYTIEWFYKDITTNSQNPIFQKLMNMDKNMKVVFKTDELGSFVEVLNWKEIKKHIKKATSSLRQDSKCRPEVEYALKQIEANLSKNKAFEPASIKHIKQFHSFHGVEYKLGEVLEGTFNGPNLYSPEPFGASFTICLEEINEKDNNFLMRTTQEVNKEQLIDATFNYLTTMANNMKVDPPKREDLKNLEKKTLLESRIDVTGWVVYSVQTITTTLDSVTNIEERMIKLK